jgi:hypothetical protein
VQCCDLTTSSDLLYSVLPMELIICGTGSEGSCATCAEGLDLMSATQNSAKRAAQYKELVIGEDEARSCDDTKHVPFCLVHICSRRLSLNIYSLLYRRGLHVLGFGVTAISGEVLQHT